MKMSKVLSTVQYHKYPRTEIPSTAQYHQYQAVVILCYAQYTLHHTIETEPFALDPSVQYTVRIQVENLSTIASLME